MSAHDRQAWDLLADVAWKARTNAHLHGPTAVTVIDGFMGAGGWSVALERLGIPSVGIELDDAPIAVARAAGHDVIQGDIAALDPLEFAPCEGCCFSPPCPSFSSAGRGAGREISEPILAVIADLAAGRDTRAQRRREAYAILEPDTAHLDELPVPRRRRKREQHAASPVDRDRIARREAKRATAKRDAAISLLVVEPLRWALALEPRWIALEQVPPVLPLWEAMAVVLRERGYSAWCGVMSSERVGVPQTRQRAILIASLDREVREPPATHQRYIAPRKRAGGGGGGEATLFEAPEPQRIVHRDDRDLLPWVSMAEALSVHFGQCKSLVSDHRPTLTTTERDTTRSPSRDDTCMSTGSRTRPSTDRSPTASSSTTCAATDGAASQPTSNLSPAPRTSCAALEHPHRTLPKPTAHADTSTTSSATTDADAQSVIESNGSPEATRSGCSTQPSGPTVPLATSTRPRTPSSVGRDRTGSGPRESVASAPEPSGEPTARRTPSSTAMPRSDGGRGDRPSWAADDRARADGEWMPQDLVGFPRRNDRPDDDAEYRERDLRAASEPAFGVTEKMRSWTRFVSNGQANATTRGVDEPDRRQVGGDGTPVALVPVDRPAPTQQAEALAQGRDVWVTGQRRNSGPGAEREPRDLSDPSYTVRAAGSGSHPSGVEWVRERPSTSVNCDPRVAEPGRHDPDEAGSQYGPATVRVSIEEAAALQGFPSSYPWEAAGTKTAAFRAVGNAICPPLALHVLAMATGRDLP